MSSVAIPAEPTERRAVSVARAAGLLDVSPAVVRRLVRSGRLQAVQTGSSGTKLIIPTAAIDAFLNHETVA